MIVLRSFLLLVEVLCSVMLIGLILLQRSKSEGLGAAFGGGMGESLFGSRAGNVLTKMTVILGSVFLVNTLALGILYAGGSATRSSISRGLLEEPAVQDSEGDLQDEALQDILRQLESIPATQNGTAMDPTPDMEVMPEVIEQPVPETEEVSEQPMPEEVTELPVPETEEGELQDDGGDAEEEDAGAER